ncbi:TetR family transcriptional regulator [Amycolatopsis deserti]|uniref:TetR family transcriptional regulator n=1 Tax=Amycolatopsis deserti TaxID=185696 RepID=A0ABQ3IVA6_9PSEU|nr:TetR/AcrR family transcriptional regulator [Amycolatopsis deserti]GHE92414.1 TetR family transcriptional regulator [Amycolatopsis deserti]
MAVVQPPSRPYRGTPAQDRVTARRDRLIKAGIDVFGTIGYRAATVQRVCAGAGLTKRYFYESFADSEALLLACYERAADQIHAAMVGAVTGAPATLADRLHAALAGYYGAIADDQRLARLTLLEILGVSPAVDAAYQAQTERFARSVELLAVEAFQASGLTPVRRHLVAQGIIGAITTTATQWLLTGRRTPLGDVVAASETLVLAVLDHLRGA